MVDVLLRSLLQSVQENRIRRKAIEQGREEMNRLWTDWNHRRLQAEAQGEAFNEPPPGTDTAKGRQS